MTLLTTLLCLGAGELPAAIHERESLLRSRMSFEQPGTGHVAFLGGSITEMNGYRPLMEKYLRERFAKTKFRFTNAGIASTCSATGAHRLQRDVLSKGRLDLIFVEFAVNDDQDAAHAKRECIRGMEGIIRQIRIKQPAADIVMIHFVNPGMLKAAQAGKARISRPAHEAVAKHYNVPSIDVPVALAAEIEAKRMTWKDYGGTHPRPKGNRFVAELVIRLLKHEWKDSPAALPARKLVTALDPANYSAGRFISPEKAKRDGFAWREPVWKKLPGSFRKRFGGRKLLVADKSGATATIEFSGRGVGIYVLAGPDAGRVEASIDGGEFQTFELYHRFSRGLHYPRTVMLATGLKNGNHRLTIRVAQAHHPQSRGSAVRILEFAAH